ncbi:hypothetical protein F4774DRAFT_56293 [Daldinia eschscholtzii]|nr:hypothetical protein F4774DRAFT_56293 [Daldinia eschscholtzii]
MNGIHQPIASLIEYDIPQQPAAQHECMIFIIIIPWNCWFAYWPPHSNTLAVVGIRVTAFAIVFIQHSCISRLSIITGTNISYLLHYCTIATILLLIANNFRVVPGEMG